MKKEIHKLLQGVKGGIPIYKKKMYIEIYLGPKTINICLCAVPGRFYETLFITKKMSNTFLDHNSSAPFVLVLFCPFSIEIRLVLFIHDI